MTNTPVPPTFTSTASPAVTATQNGDEYIDGDFDAHGDTGAADSDDDLYSDLDADARSADGH